MRLLIRTCMSIIVSSIIDQHLVKSNDSNLSLERRKSQASGERNFFTWTQENKHHTPHMNIIISELGDE